MTVEEINRDFPEWTSRLSRYIISRSTRFLTEETQKEGRNLLLWAALSILTSLGLLQISKLGAENFEFENSMRANELLPFVLEVICCYFAGAFAIDAYSDIKSWQFSSLIIGADEEDPMRDIERTRKRLNEKFEGIMESYAKEIEKIENDGEQLEKDASVATENMSVREKIELIDAVSQHQRTKSELIELLIAARQNELNGLDADREFLNFQIKSYQVELVPVVKAYRIKKWITITLPLAMFGFSLVCIVNYIIQLLSKD